MITRQDLEGWGIKSGEHFVVNVGDVSYLPYNVAGRIVYISRDLNKQINEFGLLDKNKAFSYKFRVDDEGDIFFTERRVV